MCVPEYASECTVVCEQCVCSGTSRGAAQGACAPFLLKKYKHYQISESTELGKIFQNYKKIVTTIQTDNANFTGAAAGSGITGEVKYSAFKEWKPQESFQIWGESSL